MAESKTNISNSVLYNDRGNQNNYAQNHNYNAGNNIVINVHNETVIDPRQLYKIVGYWGTWAAYRDDEIKFDYRHIDPLLFTHLIYCFFSITPDGEITHVDEWLDMEKEGGFVPKFIGLKAKNSDCKLMASIGGSSAERTENFKIVAASEEKRQKFASNAVIFMKRLGFDGLDIHWVYPEESDKENLVLLLKAIKNEFRVSGHILSVAVGPTKCRGKKLYDIPGIAENVDFINLMTYELHGAWEGVTGSSSPLYVGPDDNPDLNVDACVRHWRSEGAPERKLVLGIPTNGKSFTLRDSKVNGIKAPVTGDGAPGFLMKLPGTLSYQEIVTSGWILRWQDDQKVPYAFNGNQWVTYETIESVTEKANYIKDKKLGGAMFWSIEFDDFQNKKGLGNYPLIRAARQVLLN